MMMMKLSHQSQRHLHRIKTQHTT